MDPPVSVIIPTYNRAGFLERAIESVLRQSHRNFELVVIDDGSTDGTPDLVARYGPDIVYITQPNKGPAAARNRGIRAACHDIIAFLDSDDRFAADKLARQVAAMEKAPEYLVSHTQEIWYRRGKLLNQKKRHRKEEGDIFRRSLELCVVGMSTVMARRRFFDEVGLFDEGFPCCEDYDLWLRASVNHRFLLIDEPLTIKDGGRSDQVSVRYRMGMDRFRIQAIGNLLRSKVMSREQENLAGAELARKCRIYGEGCVKHGRVEEGQYYLSLAEGTSPG